MSRIRRATVNAVFNYAQFAVAIASGIVIVPLTIHRVGAVPYGLWLASGEILGHAGMVELGVLGVLPWMIAEADGTGDRDAIRRLIAHGAAVAVFVGACYLGVAVAGWTVLPGALRLTPEERAVVFGPLAIVVFANALGYPLRVFDAILSGLQDVYFKGLLSLMNAAAGVSVTAVMLVKGYHLYALAVGAALPMLLTLIATFARVAVIAPDLLRGWPRPTLNGARPLFRNGAGVWLGTLGWALVAASNGIVITYLGHPEWVAVYACTSKLSSMSTQLAWILPDSGLVGLAQLYGERRETSRLPNVVMMFLKLHLLLAGAAACGFLALNPAFVSRWVGPAFFGGLGLNALLAATIIVSSLTHALIVAASVLGNRPRVGAVTLANGAVQTALAILLGRVWGLSGIAVAALIAGLVTSLPAAVVLLKPSTGLTVRKLASTVIVPWGARVAPLLAGGAVVAWFYHALGLVASAASAEFLVLLYVWFMRPLYRGLPLDPAVTPWLIRLRLVVPDDLSVGNATVGVAANSL